MDSGHIELDPNKIIDIERHDLSAHLFVIEVRKAFMAYLFQLYTRCLIQRVVFAQIIGMQDLKYRFVAETAKRFIIKPKRFFSNASAVITT